MFWYLKNCTNNKYYTVVTTCYNSHKIHGKKKFTTFNKNHFFRIQQPNIISVSSQKWKIVVDVFHEKNGMGLFVVVLLTCLAHKEEKSNRKNNCCQFIFFKLSKKIFINTKLKSFFFLLLYNDLKIEVIFRNEFWSQFGLTFTRKSLLNS